MTTADCVELTDAAVAVKDALVAPDAMVNEDGTVRLALLLDKATDAPPLAAAALKVAVQVVLPGVLMVAGVHVNEVSVGVTVPVPVMVPPVPVSARELPVGSEAEVLVTLIDVLLTPEPIVTLTKATTPLEMLVAFMPVARQV